MRFVPPGFRHADGFLETGVADAQDQDFPDEVSAGGPVGEDILHVVSAETGGDAFVEERVDESGIQHHLADVTDW